MSIALSSSSNLTMPGRLRIVLVNPPRAAAVGAVARVMKNFGVTDLSIVGRMEPDPEGAGWASGAEDLLEAADQPSSLRAALEGVAHAVAVERGRDERLDPYGVANLVAGVEDSRDIALVLSGDGGELSREDRLLCDQTASIDPGGSGGGLAIPQIVGLFCYATWRHEKLRESPEISPSVLERISNGAAAILEEVDPDQASILVGRLEEILERAKVTQREGTLLLGILRQLEWRLGRGLQPPDVPVG